MNKKSGIIKEGLLVTAGGFTGLILVFILYYLLFMFFEAFIDRESTYHFVSSLRLGYGIFWLAICILLYRSGIHDILKAIFLAMSLTAFMAGTGVQLNKYPAAIFLTVALTAAISLFLLYKMKKRWYHYYAVGISVLAAIIYL